MRTEYDAGEALRASAIRSQTYATATDPTPMNGPPSTAFHLLAQVSTELSRVENRLTGLARVLVGSFPAPGADANGKTSPEGLLNMTSGDARMALQTIERMDAALSAIERQLP